MDLLAIKAAILEMADRGWPLSRITGGDIDKMAELLLPFGPEAATRTAQELASGAIDRDNAFFPTGAEMAARARVWSEAIAHRDRNQLELAAERERIMSYPIGALPPASAVPLGPLNVDLGRGVIDMTEMTPAEKEAVLSGEDQTKTTAVRAALKRF